MRVTDRTAWAAFLIGVATAGIAGISSPAAAQRRHPVVAQAAPYHVPPQQTVPYPGATVTVDPQLYLQQQSYYLRQRGMYASRRVAVQPVILPVIVDGSAYGGGMGTFAGGVTDVNGRPLYTPDYVAGQGYGLGTPSLTGTPYSVARSGEMVVDFGKGDRRAIPACAALAAAQNPDGQPRTIFYQPPADALVLRQGQSGRVLGNPPAGTTACYTADELGRIVLSY